MPSQLNRCHDIDVTVVDFNTSRIDAWHTDRLPTYEPGLLEILKPARDGVPNERRPNPFFSTDVKGAIASSDLIFLCVPTPTKITGTGVGRTADMVYVEAAARMIAEVAEDDKIIVEKSTVPCRTAEDIRKTFAAVGKPDAHFDILSNPESQHLPEVAAYWRSVIDINEYQKDRFIKRIVACLFRTPTNKKVAILGYAYKKDTGDTRESAAISIVNNPAL